ncbi:MAG: twin-arginine translocase TatA/TatE family subunit [Actinomycetota bacterium]|nr:twin-arginine translocase TatA/TatE family subunit [Actinomycetota bacterium]
MPNIGPLELAIVLIIALVIFGPKRLPELGRSVGHGLREFKSSITGDDKDDEPRTIENGVEEAPVEAEPTPVAAAKADTEAQVRAPAPSRADVPPASTTGKS